MDYQDLGSQIRAARRQQSLTQEALAERVGISASFLGHIERGTRVASLETLVALCNELNVTPQYLLRASLTSYNPRTPEGLSDRTRNRLTTFLRLAEDTVNNWYDDDE